MQFSEKQPWLSNHTSFIWTKSEGLIFGWSCVGPEVGLDDLCGFLPTWNISWFYDDSFNINIEWTGKSDIWPTTSLFQNKVSMILDILFWYMVGHLTHRKENPYILISEYTNFPEIVSILFLVLAIQKGLYFCNNLFPKWTTLCLYIQFLLSITHLSELQWVFTSDTYEK